ncbi:hypothetical protein [Kaistella antarctica]|uniref:Uncharacterized protein n=1 Tax=Kaistella antarctica TaxID=266748 RepID=A0A3S4YSN5_9FLAO|nr:hypothetical protein [Kaistella antarctica]KEY19112.1 hypothetical protein HY04_11835 [Kaistella antarctica]SEW02826.1 hypothetical protein SAMN05421765_1809 [Kaistella antarctica]VEH98868.1 Uncharacterised protein [Kaistella antarctica]
MMNIRLGDLYSLQNHPYEKEVKNVQIAGYASMTPPILVVSEILNPPKEHDAETGIAKSRQIKGIYYCHKNHKFETLWVNVKELKVIQVNTRSETESNNNNVTTDGEEFLTKGYVWQKYPKSISLEHIKELFLHKQVILKSCDLELGKLKTTFSQTAENKPNDKITAHLDFLPPVLTVIDIKPNEEKITHNPKSGNLKKISSVYLLKCKWYNPLSGSFSEDFIPIETVDIVENIDTVDHVSRLIISKEFIKQPLKEQIELESGKNIKYTYAQPIKLIFKHHKYLVKYYDLFHSQMYEASLSEFMVDDDSLKLKDLIVNKIPEYDDETQTMSNVEDYTFTIGNFYRITYRDTHNTITVRIIFIKKVIAKTIIIADCLLRDGNERHFRFKEESLLKIEVLDQSYFNKI